MAMFLAIPNAFADDDDHDHHGHHSHGGSHEDHDKHDHGMVHGHLLLLVEATLIGSPLHLAVGGEAGFHIGPIEFAAHVMVGGVLDLETGEAAPIAELLGEITYRIYFGKTVALFFRIEGGPEMHLELDGGGVGFELHFHSILTVGLQWKLHEKFVLFTRAGPILSFTLDGDVRVSGFFGTGFTFGAGH